MNQGLLFVHFLGLMLGATGGFASAIIMTRADRLGPETGRPLRELGPLLANVPAAGLALMWLSGLVLVWSRRGGPAGLPPLFWVKFLFVPSPGAAAVAVHLTYRAMRRGDPAAARLPRICPIASISALLAVLFAILAFSPG